MRTAPDRSPFQAEAVALRWLSAVTAHRVPSPEGVRQMVAPARKGSVLEHLIWPRYPSGILWRSLCSSAMSSLLHRKPKKATNLAAQRVRWSVEEAEGAKSRGDRES